MEQNYIELLRDKIYDKTFENVADLMKHDDYIIIGNNMSGKSKLIKDLIIKSFNEPIYFIDSKNRGIPTDNPMWSFERIEDIKNILETRIDKNNFNKKDMITSEYEGNLILNELINNKDKYNGVLSEFLGSEFEVLTCSQEFEGIDAIDIHKYRIGDKVYEELSNGLQAICRIIVEVIFAYDQNCTFVIIEEIDQHLDEENCRKIIKYLKFKFPEVKLLLTTHSPEIILAAEDFNIIKILEDRHFTYDSNDFNDINLIVRVLFTVTNRVQNVKDKLLSDYMRKIMVCGKLEDKDLEYIQAMSDCSIKQKVLKKYILEWNNEN